ncbi:MAG: patatin-like phospholipase family protein, partial [Magnetococcus sp. YQC-5]
TDMQQGSRFEFTQAQFNLLCADLDSFPVARAVAASSAFPFLLSPLTINAYDRENCHPILPLWADMAMKQAPRESSHQGVRRRYSLAQGMAAYLGYDYVHLLDGGISDNVGLRGIEAAILDHDLDWSLKQLIDVGKIREVVIVTVNAKNAMPHEWSRQESAPGIISVIDVVANVPIDAYSFDSVERVDLEFRHKEQSQKDFEQCRNELRKSCNADLGSSVLRASFHTVEVSFAGLLPGPDQERLESCLNRIPTSFHLSRDEVDLLRQAARNALYNSAGFQSVMKSLAPQWTPPAAPIDPVLFAAVCTAR